jgi:hypothetical protein
MGVDGAHRLGLTGAGVRIGILGGTVRTDHQAFAGSDLLATRDFVEGDDDVSPRPGEEEAAAPTTAAWSLAGARAPDVLVGPAFGSSFLLARTFAGEGAPREDEGRWVQGLEWLESQGARVAISDGGFRAFDDGFAYVIEDLDGATAPATVAAVLASERGVLVVAPVGDLGPGEGTLVAPSDGDGVLSAGAVAGDETVASLSSEGPTANGRPKPDAYAPGVDVPVAGAGSPTELVVSDGTALAAALLAGGAALFAEAHPERTPVQIAEALAASATTRVGLTGAVRCIDVGSAIAFPDGVVGIPIDEVDAQGQVTTLTPLFRWDAPTIYPPALPVSFTILVAADSTFQDVLLADRVVGTFARRLSRPLPPRQRIFWRVNAETPQAITRRTETQGPLTVPAWLRLTVLNNPAGQTIEERRPIFEWEPFEALDPPAGPLTYDLDVFSDRDEESVAAFAGLDTTRFRVPDPLPLNEPLRWSVVARAPGGQADTVVSAGPFVVVSTSSPPATILFQNFPNPFPNAELGLSETRIWFDLSREGPVQLTVYDLRGRLVRRLVPAVGCSEVVLPPGIYGREEGGSPDPCVQLSWDGTDESGRNVEPGVYLLRLRAGGTEGIRRMVYWP